MTGHRAPPGLATPGPRAGCGTWAACLLLTSAAMLPGAAGFKIIGAGYPKTGIASLEAALRMMGFTPYRMGHRDKMDTMGHMRDLQRWLDVLGNNTMDTFDALVDDLIVRGYDTILDVPMDVTVYTLRLVERFPAAKVILTEHADSQAWFRSFKLHMEDFKMSSARFSPRPEVTLDPVVHALRKVHEAVCQKKLGLPLAPSDADAEAYVAAYEQHNADIKAGVPIGRLLEFEPQRGWDPLSEFLGMPAPLRPYPHMNTHRQDLAHLEWQKWYNLKFELFLLVIMGSFVVTVCFWMSGRLKASAKVWEEKANV